MKKFIAFALAAVLLSCLFVSCGEYRFEYMKEDLTPYITAGEYLNLTVTIPAADEVTDEDVEEKIAEKIAKYSTTEPVDRACKLGDTVNIDFVGRVDGAEFEGGTASDQDRNLCSERPVILKALRMRLSVCQRGKSARLT